MAATLWRSSIGSASTMTRASALPTSAVRAVLAAEVAAAACRRSIGSERPAAWAIAGECHHHLSLLQAGTKKGPLTLVKYLPYSKKKTPNYLVVEILCFSGDLRCNMLDCLLEYVTYCSIIILCT
jgi:hypothetical protein